jgi:hypothetical protein
MEIVPKGIVLATRHRFGKWASEGDGFCSFCSQMTNNHYQGDVPPSALAFHHLSNPIPTEVWLVTARNVHKPLV